MEHVTPRESPRGRNNGPAAPITAVTNAESETKARNQIKVCGCCGNAAGMDSSVLHGFM